MMLIASTVRRCVAVLLPLLTLLLPRTAWACATCFGDPKSELVKGAKAGVLVLAIIVYGVVFSMVGVAGFWAFRARKLASAHRDVDAAGPTPDHDA